MEKKKDGRLIAQKNEIRVLRALQRFGWLRTKDIAQLCWTKWKNRPQEPFHVVQIEPRESALRMSQRTMKRLLQKRQVIAATAPNGSIIYALAEAGVRILSELGLQAKSGKDLTRGFSAAFFKHRCIANEIAIASIIQGFRVSTEREIAQGYWFGGLEGIDGKRPDVVIRDEEQVIFVEVERSRKNTTDYQALLSWLKKQIASQGASIPNSEGRNVVLCQVVFICTKNFQAKLQKDLQAYGVTESQQRAFIRYSTDLYILGHTLFL